METMSAEAAISCVFCRIVRGELTPEVLANNERHGGQDVFHVHLHVLPRFAGDAFTTGNDRFPFGAVEVPLEEHVEQAKKLSKALGRPIAKMSGGAAHTTSFKYLCTLLQGIQPDAGRPWQVAQLFFRPGISSTLSTFHHLRHN